MQKDFSGYTQTALAKMLSINPEPVGEPADTDLHSSL